MHSEVRKIDPTLKADRRWSQTIIRGRAVCTHPPLAAAPMEGPFAYAASLSEASVLALQGKASSVVTGNVINKSSSLTPREYLRSIGSMRFKKWRSEKSRVWSIRGAKAASSRQSLCGWSARDSRHWRRVRRDAKRASIPSFLRNRRKLMAL